MIFLVYLIKDISLSLYFVLNNLTSKISINLVSKTASSLEMLLLPIINV